MFGGQDGEIKGKCTGEKKVGHEKRPPEISKEFLQGPQLSTDWCG